MKKLPEFKMTLTNFPITAHTTKLRDNWICKPKLFTYIRKYLRKGMKIELSTLAGIYVFTVNHTKNGWAHLRAGSMCIDLKKVGKKCWRYDHFCYNISLLK